MNIYARINPCRLLSFGAIALGVLLGGCAGVQPAREFKPPVYPGPPDEPRFIYERSIFSTGDVAPPGREAKLRELLTGQTARSGVGFGKPFDIAASKGRIYVTDSVLRHVVVLDYFERRWFEIGNWGDEGDITKPLGIALDGNGRVYVCDGAQKAVFVYDRDGNYKNVIGNRELLDRPSGIDVNPEGTRLYVVDTGGVDSDKHHVSIFDIETGKHIRDIGHRGDGEGELNLARDVILGSDGLLYVTDGGNFRVQVFTQEGDFVREWGEPGKRLGQFSRPKGIALSPQGNIYVVDAAFGNFQIFNPEGDLLLFVGTRSEVSGAGRFMLPAGIAVDEDGRVYMTDQFFRKVEVFRPATLGATEGYLAGPQPEVPVQVQPVIPEENEPDPVGAEIEGAAG